MLDISFPNEATPIGSTVYYVARFSKTQFQDELAALFLWKKELYRLYTLSDPGVARIKLQWWLQQISQPLDNPHEHPLVNKLGALYHSSNSASSAFRKITAETDRQLHRQPYSTIQDFWQGCITIGGNYALLLQQINDLPDESDTLINGAWICFIEWLQNLGDMTRHNIQVLPDDLLIEYQLKPEQLLEPHQQDKIQTMLLGLVNRLLIEPGLPEATRAKTSLAKYFKLRLKLFDLLRQENFPVMHQRISLTPIRKLWFVI